MSVIVVILSGAANPEATQARETRLAALIERLGLTQAGAPGWLEKLGVSQGSAVQTERVLIVSLSGETILEVKGREGRVSATDEMNERLYGEGPDVVLVHNHPSGTSLSANDLMQLSKRRTSVVVAIGHDGSVYAAAAGPRYAGAAFGRGQYGPACDEVERRLSFYSSGPLAASRRLTVPAFRSHLVALALQRASVIEYHALLTPATQAKFAPLADDAERAVAAAARRLAGANRARSAGLNAACDLLAEP
jgi:hypothetical protein